MANLPQPPFPLPFPAPKTTDELVAHTIHFTEGIDETKPLKGAVATAGFFATEAGLLQAAQAARAAGHTALQAWSPYPVHGLDPVLGLQRSLLGRPVFMTALAGFAFCFIGIAYLMVFDWPVIYAGRPYFTWTLWVVPMLEAGLLFAALANLKLCFAACKLLPDPFTRLPDPRLTDDQFCLAISAGADGVDPASAEALLRAAGANAVRAIDAGTASGEPVFRPLEEPTPAAASDQGVHAHA